MNPENEKMINFDYQNTVSKATNEHSRKVSQFEFLEQELGLYFDPDEAKKLAKETMKEINPIASEPDLKKMVETVKKKHSRKVSQYQSLEQELRLHFDDDEAKRIARQTMKDINPYSSQAQSVSIDQIVQKAKRDHKRKVSQFKAIKDDIGQYFPNEQEASKLASDIMREFNPNDRSGKGQEVTVDSIVEKAMKEHKRTKSRFQAIEEDLGLIFDKEDVNAITKDVMKKVFAQKHSQQTDTQNDQLEKGYVEQLQKQVRSLENDLQNRNNEIDKMKRTISDLEDSKVLLAQNADKCVNEMRGYLLQYQQSILPETQ